ncbi:hypothetical protein [Gordonia liuliyuniae]|uniref:Mce-associated membrane protein n=1 Tax=Gordonia liuliyuniae TaxID=2911517 RepID=A0ABS9IW49_9ACTN|nr:hypothetical protein [Gordonia liuliyuniae]MCF8589786.1 hypothetical protein [Gordonia liuliyuniae]
MPSDRHLAALRAARVERRTRRGELDTVLSEQRRSSSGGPTRGSRRSLPIVFAVLSVVLAGVAVWQYLVAPHHYSDAEYVSATTDRVRLLVEADSDDQGRAERILSGATGAFHDSFAQSADAYTQFVASAETSGAGSVDGVGLARREGDSALMLVAASVRVATSTGQDEAPAAFRMRVLMTPEDGELKIAAVEVLG